MTIKYKHQNEINPQWLVIILTISLDINTYRVYVVTIVLLFISLNRWFPPIYNLLLSQVSTKERKKKECLQDDFAETKRKKYK